MRAKKLMVTRDQERAILAYDVVGKIVGKDKFDNFATLINNVGAQIIKNGLAATLAFVDRYHDQNASKEFKELLVSHFNGLGIAGIERSDESTITAQIRRLNVPEYMLVTRELLKLIVWVRRASQARKMTENPKVSGA